MLKFAVCDDNIIILNRLTKLLESIFLKNNLCAEVVLSSNSSKKLIEYTNSNTLDVLILDIDFKSECSGLELAKKIRAKNKDMYLIFSTGHLEYALIAYKLKTFDYLPKPVAPERLEETVNRIFDDIKLENLDDIDGGLKKAKVKVKFASVNKDIDTLTLAIIGVNTNYKGNIYIDNIELSQEKAEDIYVEITEKIKHQIAIDVNYLEVAKDIKLVDEKVSKETAALYSYLKGLSKTDKVIFGHQNDTHHIG